METFNKFVLAFGFSAVWSTFIFALFLWRVLRYFTGYHWYKSKAKIKSARYLKKKMDFLEKERYSNKVGNHIPILSSKPSGFSLSLIEEKIVIKEAKKFIKKEIENEEFLDGVERLTKRSLKNLENDLAHTSSEVNLERVVNRSVRGSVEEFERAFNARFPTEKNIDFTDINSIIKCELICSMKEWMKKSPQLAKQKEIFTRSVFYRLLNYFSGGTTIGLFLGFLGSMCSKNDPFGTFTTAASIIGGFTGEYFYAVKLDRYWGKNERNKKLLNALEPIIFVVINFPVIYLMLFK